MAPLKQSCQVIRMYVKEIKNAPECIVELHKHAGILKNTREVQREARGVAEYFSHFSSVHKNSKCLYNSTMHEDKFFISFIKC